MRALFLGGGSVNPESRWRRQFARYVADQYAVESLVAGVMISGSAARGHADRFSDAEVGVFWREPPEQELRQRVMHRIIADGKRAFAFESAEQLYSEDYFVGRAEPQVERSGLLVEVSGYCVGHINRVIDAVLVQADPDPLKQNLISGILHGIPVKGEDILGEWQRRCIVYPDSLADAVVRHYGKIDHFWRWRMWLERENRMMFDHHIVDVQQRLLHLLLAVNRVYYFGFKWLPRLFSRLEYAPKDFPQRFGHVNVASPEQAAESLRELVEETYDLIELRMPESPVQLFRQVFRWERPQWDEKCPPVHPPLSVPDEGLTK
jgi:hypothetical protein